MGLDFSMNGLVFDAVWWLLECLAYTFPRFFGRTAVFLLTLGFVRCEDDDAATVVGLLLLGMLLFVGIYLSIV